MKKKSNKIKKIILMLIIMTIPCGIYAQAGTDNTEISLTMSEVAAQKIMLIRNNPMDYAQEAGVDQNILIANFPWMQDTTGFIVKSIKASENLIEKNIETEKIKITDTNSNKEDKYYFKPNLPTLSGSVSGVISFKNYMEKQDALSIFINSLFKNESSLEYTKKRFMLDIRFNQVQAEVKSIENDENNFQGLNQYEVKLFFASDADASLAETINIINFVRNNPWVSVNYILKYFPDSYENFYHYIYPVVENNLEPFFDDCFSKNNKKFNTRAQGYGYFIPLDSMKYIERAAAVFMMHDLTGKNSLPFVFSSYTKNLGLDIEEFSYNNVTQIYIVKYQLTGFFPESGAAESETEEKSNLTGVYLHITKDKNLDTLYNPGEGLSDKEIFIINPITNDKIKYFTDNTGRVQLWLEKNQTYLVGYDNNDEYFEKTIKTYENRKYVKIDL